jgi:hypothetical protein
MYHNVVLSLSCKLNQYVLTKIIFAVVYIISNNVVCLYKFYFDYKTCYCKIKVITSLFIYLNTYIPLVKLCLSCIHSYYDQVT